ncbi:MAG: RtcB family protein [Alphaproteobacteria bacterium]|nr:RtcB family protein [Alphaproteobacteria bacterium]
MQPHPKSPTDERLFRALARQGLVVTRDGPFVSVRSAEVPDAPPAEILLPAELPLEGRAARQLADLAAVHHPDGGRACRACATPDVHPGDSGVAIGSVLETRDLLVPQAVGTDINCGMRLHTLDLELDRFLSRKDELVRRLRGDLLLGTRDVGAGADAMRAMFAEGVPAFLEAASRDPVGSLARMDLGTAFDEVDAIFEQGSLPGDAGFAPETLVKGEGVIRDDGLATVGRGNHFVELQVVEEVVDRHLAWEAGLRPGRVVLLVHSGSRMVGKIIGKGAVERARAAWPVGARHPGSGLFPLSWSSRPDLCEDYLRAEATAANYAFVNRQLLAELVRLRVREVWGELDAPLVADIPHNLTFREGDRWVARKGACPAHDGQWVLIPGSMGTASYVCVGRGADRTLRSASHGAGRAVRRQDTGRMADPGLDGVDCQTLRPERLVQEAPAAYKPIGLVIDVQVAAGSIGVVARTRPLLTFKG